ncbi:NACHT domain-containing protein [Streptomyces sp. NPDC057877]|uniref:NACHT domain-containing protein n=1 Tax=Streptomyces sp. NPDC057877 TaxID=3346269 RepID=UPI003685E0F3
MSGGRPPKGDQQRHPELEELADWFQAAIAAKGFTTLNSVVRAELAHRNVVYGINNATRLFRLEQVKSYALALGRDPASVEPVWVRAKEAMDRAADAARWAEQPRLTTWAELPEPSLSLKTLLDAQARAVERLPYDMMKVEEPPLSAVYVRQRVRALRESTPETAAYPGGDGPGEADHGAEPVGIEARMPVAEAFARHEHLLITGEPGAGKSTLTSHLASTLARIWLRQETSLSAPLSEPVLPVRVAAHALVGESESLSAALHRAVRRGMGLSLVADPAPWLFQDRVHGARWLVLLDGLDEITDRDARRAVIKAIAQHTLGDGNYRFVITSRPLPDSELLPLRTTSLGEYIVEPFGDKELREFATRWFTAQFGAGERERAATQRFLKETEDSRLRELVRNPLLATIAAVNATVNPDRPLPTNRVSLYQSFLIRLLDQGTSDARTGRSALLRRFRDDPDRLELHLWLERNKREALRVLGRHRLEQDGSLVEAAMDWVRQQAPTLVDRLPEWQEDLPDFLRGTGLLVGVEDGYRFLHHSFAEYFAAEAYVAEVPPDFPDPEEWFWRAARAKDQTLPVFVLCLWANRPDCDPDLLAERLLTGTTGGHRRSLLGGLLLAEGVRFTDSHARQVVERLLLIGTCCWDKEHQTEAFRMLGGLGHVPGLAEGLQDLARSVRQTTRARLQAVQAFSGFGSAEVATGLLIEVLGGVRYEIERAADIACGLGQEARDAVRCRALRITADPEYSWLLGYVVNALAKLDASGDVARLAPVALSDHSVGPGTVRKVSEAWLTSAPESAPQVAGSIVELILARPAWDVFSYQAAGEVLEKFGESSAAARIARRLLADDQLWHHPLKWATEALTKVEGDEARPVLAEALARSTPDSGQSPWIPAHLHSALADQGFPKEAAAWARDMLCDSHWSLGHSEHPVATWLKAEGLSAVDSVMNLTRRGHRVLPYHRAAMAQALLDAGARDEAEEIADLAMRTPHCLVRGYEVAARLLIKVRGVGAIERMLEHWRSTTALGMNSDWLEGVRKALPECEEQWHTVLPQIGELGRSLVTLPSARGDDIMSGFRLLLSVEGAEAVPLVVRTATGASWLTWENTRELASLCLTLHRRQAALSLWHHILRNNDPDFVLPTLVDMGDAEATAEAVRWIEEFLTDDTLPDFRAYRLRQLLAWLREGDRSRATTPSAIT